MSTYQTVGRPMEILLIEDGLVDARVTIGALKHGGFRHRLTLVRDGQEAMEFLHQQGPFEMAPRPDLILLDLMLPKKSGLDVLNDIKHDEKLRAIPVVVMTNSAAEEDQLQCRSLNVDEYIIKPLNLEKFLDLVKKLKKFWLDDVTLPAVD